MNVPFLHTASGAYDLAAIMHRAWVRARNTVAWHAKLGMATSVREAFADALRATWDEARSARSLAAWQAEQAREAEALAALDARTREIAALRFARVAADGIESGPAYRAEVRAIDARLHGSRPGTTERQPFQAEEIAMRTVSRAPKALHALWSDMLDVFALALLPLAV